MNTAFVNVKVDREERPDVDAIYMDAVQAMTGRGGWPMTVFLTPQGEPFYGGTYYPRPTFLQLIDAVSSAWRDRRGELVSNVTALARGAGAIHAVHAGGGARRIDDPGRRRIDRRRLRPGMGRVRRGAEVPVDDGPRPAPRRGRPPRGWRRAHPAVARRGLDVARCDGVGRDLRPPRRRLRPLLGRRALARAPLREDALRPGAASSACTPTPRRRRRAAVAPGRRRDRRVRAPRPAPAGRRILLGRGCRLPRARRAQPRGAVLHVDAGRGRRRRSAPTPRRRVRVLRHHRRRELRREASPLDPQPHRQLARRLAAARRDRGRPPGAVRRPPGSVRGRASTTRCSPSGTP